MLLLILILSTALLLIYAVVILVFYLKLPQKVNRDAEPVLPLTVVIPFRNEAQKLPAILRDLSAQQYPAELMEVILVDDHSEDGSRKIVEKWREDNHFPTQLLALRDSYGKKNALRLAVGSARNPYILQTDADCRLSPLWLRSSISPLVGEAHIAALGLVRMQGKGRWLPEMFALEFMSLQACGAALAQLRQPVLSNGANLAYRKKDWLDAEKSLTAWAGGDDVFFIQNLVRKNIGEICYNPHSVVDTHAPDSLRGFLMQRVRWGGKTPDYPLKSGIYLAALIVGVNLSLLTLLVWSLITGELIYFGLLAWGIKAVTDFALLAKFARLSGQRDLMRWFLPVQLLYPFYILLSGILITFAKPLIRWKGRELKED